MAEQKKAEKVYTSIVDALLDDREPDWKGLEMTDEKKSGEEVADRTHQYVDTEFTDDIAESASRHTPVWPAGKAGSAEKEAQRNRLNAARRGSALSSKDEGAFSGVQGSDANWRQSTTATQHPQDYKSSVGDDDSLFAEVTETLESAASTGKVEKKDISDGAVQRYIHNLLNQGESPAKIAKKLEKLAEIELFNHQTATRYLQDNAGMVGMAYLEPNTYMDKSSPTYERGKQGSSNDCVAQKKAWDNAGIKPKAASVKQVRACEGCQFFSKDKAAGTKNCNLYHLPVVANTKELSPIVNHLTPGVPVKQKRAALVQIANGNDGTKVNLVPRAPTKTASGLSAPVIGSVQAQAKRAARVAPITWDASHVGKLHAAGHSLKAITLAAEKKFGTYPAAQALSGFVATRRANVNGQIVLAKADADFLKSRGVHGKNIVAGAKCACCVKAAPAAKSIKASALSRVPQNYVESTPEMLRTARVKDNPVLDGSVIEHYHKKGHPLAKIYKSAAAKYGTAQAGKAVKEFIANLKNNPTKIALSQIDCTFLKQKLAVHNPIVGAAKCGSCTYRTGMHCGLTGGTLLSFPGMDKQGSNHKQASDSPVDGRSILAEYELTSATARPGDSKMADIEMTSNYEDVQISGTPHLGDI